MSTQKKPRADSVLKTLPPDRQAAIADYARAKTLTETRQWLAQDGVTTSETALSEFLCWFALQQQLSRNESTVETLKAKLLVARPDWTPEQIHNLGQAFFSELALAQQDSDIWTATQRLQLDRESAKTRAGFEREKIELRKQAEARAQEKLKFEREKWITDGCRKLLIAATDERAKQIAESNVSNEEKIKLLRQAYFADVDALEKSGEVQLPQ